MCNGYKVTRRCMTYCSLNEQGKLVYHVFNIRTNTLFSAISTNSQFLCIFQYASQPATDKMQHGLLEGTFQIGTDIAIADGMV